MDKSVATKSPYFDGRKLRNELTALVQAHENEAANARPAVLDRLKQLLKTAREEADRQLQQDGNGRRCAEGLSKFQDELIRLVYDFTVAHVYRSTNPSNAEHMAIVATGGYGRGMLAPFSDVDLLFLLPYKQTPWGESVVEYMLYLLWDLGLKVGHATRTIEQSVKLSRTDFTIRTALLDSRFVLGDDTLFRDLMERFRSDVVQGTAKQFVEAKLAERDDRHKRAGESRYRVEPNIKDGKGGLRDLHTLHWLSKYLYDEDPGDRTARASVFMPDEKATFRRCENFLWTVRCHLHFLTGRPEERLSFDVQQAMAELLGYADRGGLRGVERFMKHYFLVAKDVGDLTTILCSALEIEQVKASPGLGRLLNPLTWRARRQIRTRSDFRVDNGRLNVADPDVFKRDPVNLIRFFARAEETGSFFHPNAVRLIRRSLRLIDDNLRNDPEANRIFLDLLCTTANPRPLRA
jgi:[protein-PII] uridylyltransferase